MNISEWFGGSHGDWCKEYDYVGTCNYCGQWVYYWQCSHGSKVFFHRVPWLHGEWDGTCPCIDPESGYHGNNKSVVVKSVKIDQQTSMLALHLRYCLLIFEHNNGKKIPIGHDYEGVSHWDKQSKQFFIKTEDGYSYHVSDEIKKRLTIHFHPELGYELKDEKENEIEVDSLPRPSKKILAALHLAFNTSDEDSVYFSCIREMNGDTFNKPFLILAWMARARHFLQRDTLLDVELNKRLTAKEWEQALEDVAMSINWSCVNSKLTIEGMKKLVDQGKILAPCSSEDLLEALKRGIKASQSQRQTK